MMRYALSSVFVFASVLAVAYFLVQPITKTFSHIGTDQVAIVSQMGASVSENSTNRIALDLKLRAQELDSREKSLHEREAILLKEQQSIAHRTRDILATTLGFSILILLFMHFYTKQRNDSQEHIKNREYQLRHARILNTGLRVTIDRINTKHHIHT